VVRVRIHDEDGFGLIELLIALTILAIGITAIVAGFSSGIVALQRSSQVSTAGVLADQQMESYRRVRFSAIALDTTLFAGVDSTYQADTAYAASPPGGPAITNACAGSPTTSDYYYCNPSRTTIGPDGRSYRIDSYVRWTCILPGTVLNVLLTPPTCAVPAGVAKNRPARRINVVVRGGNPTRALVREVSVFDESTG